MKPTLPICLFALAALAGCAAPHQPDPIRYFNVDITHPAPFANYLRIAPGSLGADLPPPRAIKSRHFSRYLRYRTGCVVDGTRATQMLGNKSLPSAYVVPISCN